MITSRPSRIGTRRFATTAMTSLCLLTLVIPFALPQHAAAASLLPVSDAYRPSADIGFHDSTNTGTAREIRNDLTGDLGAMIEFSQATTVNPVNNAPEERPTMTADRVALLMVTPTSAVNALTVEVSVNGVVKGALPLDHPSALPASDQHYDSRGSVAYSLKAWSVPLPSDWVKQGMTLSITDDAGRVGTLTAVDISAPVELVINNIRLGMLTDAPATDSQPFITDPATSATDYFQTIPVSKLTVAQYETVKLDKVIVASGAIFTPENPDPSVGSVYAGTMRENVGKAQVSTGINLATWGVTSSPMTQKQPGHTNQRVIHHSAGLYMQNGSGGTAGPYRMVHGLSGGNGMATLYASTGNELSHELGHSYGIGHYPGFNGNLPGDAAARNASHHMDSGWGYIPYRGLMRSNLATAAYKQTVNINGKPFAENLAGKYNFNTDAMSGGWDASPVSNYTLHTSYTLKRIQSGLKRLVADLNYPSGYRHWDPKAGDWVDAKALDASFSLLKPQAVGVPVFTILGGYNPADPAQTLVYDAFRSNYGVTFNLPQSNPTWTSTNRSCWLQVTFQNAATQHITLDPSNGVKQLNVNIAETERPTGAQVNCRQNGVTTAMGDPITIATDLKPMSPAVVVGQEAGFETLRAKELGALDGKLTALSDAAAPVISANDMVVLKGWSDDLSLLTPAARVVADRVLKLHEDAASVEAYLAEHGGIGIKAEDLPGLSAFLAENGYVGAQGEITPASTPATVHNGRCAYLDDNRALRADMTLSGNKPDCAGKHPDTWFVDVAGRIHSGENPQLCITHGSRYSAAPCSMSNIDQRWIFKDTGEVVRASTPSSAMDLNLQTSFVSAYSAKKSSNQIWQGFAQNTNPLLAYLSANGLAAFAGKAEGAGIPEPEAPPVVTPEPEAPPAITPEPEAPPAITPEPEAPPAITPEPEAPEVAEPTPPEPGIDFADVAKGHKFYNDITWMKTSGLSTGVKIDGKSYYQPKNPVSREAMAAFLYRMSTPEGKKAPQGYTPPKTSPFIDVPTSHKFYKDIAWMYQSGLSTGIQTPAGRTFAPKQSVTREAMAAFLYRLEHATHEGTQASPFADVGKNHKFHAEISWMHKTGLSTGIKQPAGKPHYQPKNAVSREAMAAFLYRLKH